MVSPVAELRLQVASGVVPAQVVWAAPVGERGRGRAIVLFADAPLAPERLEDLLSEADGAIVAVCVASGRLSVGEAQRITSWIAAHAEELDFDPEPLRVSGDGNASDLARAVCARARHTGWPVITHPTKQEETTRMRKITAGLFITLDGVTENPEQWQGPYMDRELGGILHASMSRAETLLLGRKTYEEWAGYWPAQGSENPFAAAINGMPKLVASATRTKLDWENSSVIEGDVPSALREIKQQDGGDVLINGSATLVRSLIVDGVIDELNLLVHPVIAGRGARLFDGIASTRMELADATALSNGVVSLTYILTITTPQED